MAVKLPKQERDAETYTKILGVDTSSTSLAWTFLYRGSPMQHGKLQLKEKSIEDRLGFIYREWRNLLLSLEPDHTFIEKSIFVKNPSTARTLSYVVGTVMAVTNGEGFGVSAVEPGTWKAFMGYHNLSRQFVADACNALGQKEGKKLCERMRKSQTWRVIQHNYPMEAAISPAIDDHDIADSWGIALYGHNLMAEELQLEKGKDISLDVPYLATLGLTL
jgi:Holliday junction resolvasome RuvABC endonuclease subunit